MLSRWDGAVMSCCIASVRAGAESGGTSKASSGFGWEYLVCTTNASGNDWSPGCGGLQQNSPQWFLPRSMNENIEFIKQRCNIVANTEEMNVRSKWVLSGRTSQLLFKLNRFIFSRVALPHNHQMSIVALLNNGGRCSEQHVQSFAHADLTDRAE